MALVTPKLTIKDTIAVLETHAEVPLPNERHDHSLQPDHHPDKDVDQQQQRVIGPGSLEAPAELYRACVHNEVWGGSRPRLMA